MGLILAEAVMRSAGSSNAFAARLTPKCRMGQRNTGTQGLCRLVAEWPLSGPAMIPFIDLAAQPARIRPALDAAIARVLAHGAYVMGPEVRDLEGRLAAFTGA